MKWSVGLWNSRSDKGLSEWPFSPSSFQHCPKLPLRAHLMLGHVMWLSLAKEDPRESCPDRCPLLVAGTLSGQFFPHPVCLYSEFQMDPFSILSLRTAQWTGLSRDGKDCQHSSVNLEASGWKIQMLLNCFAENNHHIVLFAPVMIIHRNRLWVQMGSDLSSAPDIKFTEEKEVSCTAWANVAPSLFYSLGSFYQAQGRQARSGQKNGVAATCWLPHPQECFGRNMH